MDIQDKIDKLMGECEDCGCGKDHKNKKKKKVEESSNEKKEQMYQQGLYDLRSAFSYNFSQGYMRGMGLMTQNKSAVDTKYKKMRDAIATAYEKLDDAISKHVEVIEKKSKEKMKR